MPCDYDRIFDIVERKKALFHPSNDVQRAIGRVIVAADSAHAFGASYMRAGERIMCGNVADFTSFSFHAVKNLTTAEGGALTWRTIEGFDDEYIYKQFMLLSLHGQTKDALHKNGLGNWEYDIVAPSYKCNMTDIQAAIGLVQLDRYEGLLKRRRDIIERYDEAFKPLGLFDCASFYRQAYIERTSVSASHTGHRRGQAQCAYSADGGARYRHKCAFQAASDDDSI